MPDKASNKRILAFVVCGVATLMLGEQMLMQNDGRFHFQFLSVTCPSVFSGGRGKVKNSLSWIRYNASLVSESHCIMQADDYVSYCRL